ncbi:MAG: T9SS type A sorting domain-containing protein [Bacteroidetes bacterium]|nr:T9SS type A sorting domain-containing protein [Bacteroidota bacterium]
MRRAIIFLISIVTVCNSIAQNLSSTEKIEGQSPINIGLNEVNKSFTPPSADFFQLKSGGTTESNIEVTYIDFPEDAKAAFEYAISIWEHHLNSSVPITVHAKWESLGNNILAHSRPTEFYKNFDAAPISNVYYPIALVEKLSGKELNNSEEADIVCSFNKNSSWYFGTNGNTSVTSYDFITVVLHEMAHGFGISGFLSDENGVGEINNTGNFPSIYDYNVYNSSKQRITDNSIFNSPSTELHKQLTSNNLDFGCPGTDCDHGKSSIYVPSSWVSGVSFYHLKSAQSGSANESELMSAFLYKGAANHNPGINTLNVLFEMGWDSETVLFKELKDVEDAVVELPVQIKVGGDMELNTSSVQVIFSTDNFQTKDSVLFSYNTTSQLFEANLPLNNYKGKVSYYYNAKSTSNETVTFPNQAPANVLSFKIGPDYYSPQLSHNPLTMVSSSKAVINFQAIASDNVGIGSVTVEYLINGVAQVPFELSSNGSDTYSGNMELPFEVYKNDKIEYTIIAEDNSARKNRKILPSNGYFEIEGSEENAITTANEEIFADSEVKMYPNPCTNNLFIDCMEMVNSSSVEVCITDLYGKTVYRETRYDIQNGPTLKVDLGNITSGVYLASITSSDSKSVTQKIVKN